MIGALSDAWNLLVKWGLPDGPARPAPRGSFDPATVREAVLVVGCSARLATPKVAPLLAWLRAWRHHWAACFIETFGAAGDELIGELRARLDDQNRYLKLRRIAIQNLAGIL